jgi:sulfate transport system ATP-binding protein
VSRTDEGGGLWAVVTDVRVSGAIVKMEVTGDERQPMQIELGREQYEQIRAIIGEKVYVKPRKVRVFMEDLNP